MSRAERWTTPGGMVVLALAVTLWRLVVLQETGHNLSFDEAQYWHWSLDFQFGYFSKPPLVAWIIGLVTALFGEGEVAIRAAVPVTHGVTSVLVFLLGRRLYGPLAGLWAGLVFLLMPGVTFSSLLVSTDPFLLTCWAGALLALTVALEEDRLGAWAALGLALGVGLLAKYAMAYFVPCFLVFLAASPAHRSLLRRPGPWLALGLGLLLLAPNLAWNAAHGFVTLAHTQANANLGGPLFHPHHLAEFIGAQAGVFGPIPFIAFVWLLVRPGARPADPQGLPAGRLLVSFSLPILALVSLLALLSRANANWAAPAFVAAAVWVAGALSRSPGRRAWLWATLALHLLAAGVLANYEATLKGLGIGITERTDIQKRLRGWDEVGAWAMDLRRRHPGVRLLFDSRKVMTPLLYYVRPHPLDAGMWNPDGHPENHYELTADIAGSLGEDFLYLTRRDDASAVAGAFGAVESLGVMRLVYPSGHVLAVRAYLLRDFRGHGSAGDVSARPRSPLEPMMTENRLAGRGQGRAAPASPGEPLDPGRQGGTLSIIGSRGESGPRPGGAA